jgi:hypothetical protein
VFSPHTIVYSYSRMCSVHDLGYIPFSSLRRRREVYAQLPHAARGDRSDDHLHARRRGLDMYEVVLGGRKVSKRAVRSWGFDLLGQE